MTWRREGYYGAPGVVVGGEGIINFEGRGVKKATNWLPTASLLQPIMSYRSTSH